MKTKIVSLLFFIIFNSAYAKDRAPAQTSAPAAQTPAAAPQAEVKPVPEAAVQKRQGPASKRAKMWNDQVALASFELSALYIDQGSNQNSSTAMVAWTPASWFNESFAAGLHLGISGIQVRDSAGDKKTAPLYDYEAFIRYAMRGVWDIQLGGGTQTWGQGGGSASVGMAQLGYDPIDHVFGCIDRFFVSYARFEQKVKPANEYGLGIGILF